MAAPSRRHTPQTRTEWLRVAAVIAGLGAAITTGQGVAWAVPADSSGDTHATGTAGSGIHRGHSARATASGSSTRNGPASTAAQHRSSSIGTKRKPATTSGVRAAAAAPDASDRSGSVSSGRTTANAASSSDTADSTAAAVAIDIPPTPSAAATRATTADAAPAAVTVRGILTDAVAWIGLDPVAGDLPIPAAPVSALVQSLWLAVRENQYRPSGQRFVAESAAVGAPLADAAAEHTTTDSVVTEAATDGAGADAGALTDIVGRDGIDVTLKSDGMVDTIDGTFTDTVVQNSSDATRLLNQLAPLLGASSSFASLGTMTASQVDTTDSGGAAETFYRLHENVDGVAALGSEVILVADENGTVTGLFNNHDGRIADVDTTVDPSVDQQCELVALANAAYLGSTGVRRDGVAMSRRAVPSTYTDGLVVYALDADTAPVLAWRVVVDPAATGLPAATTTTGTTYYVDANGPKAGTVIAQTSNADAVSTTSTASDLWGQSHTFTVNKQNLLIFSLYTMSDTARKIAAYSTTYAYLGLGGPVLPGILVYRGLFGGWDKQAVSVYTNLTTVYDYYETVLGQDSFDDNGAAVVVSVHYNPRESIVDYFTGYRNAFWDPTLQQFAFGSGGKLAGALDVVGHEFTHAVVSYAVGDGGSVLDYGEPGALNEAFADIMGMLIEGKSGTDRWLIGEDSTYPGGALRNLADPSSISTAYGAYRDNYADRYLGSGDDGGEHINSTIFSHAAYLMMTDPAASGIADDTWATVFYHSLFRLSPGATFTDGRAAVISSARTNGFTDAQIAAIEDAFDAVGDAFDAVGISAGVSAASVLA